eukprot:gene15133-20372_t
MALSDKILGFLLLSVSLVIFTYYSIWVLILPFIEKDHPIFKYFLPKEFAISIPATILVIVMVAVGLFVGSVLRNEAIRNKKK